jgi:hypothetical protein
LKSFAGFVGGSGGPRGGNERGDPRHEQRLEERTLGREIAVHGADSDLRPLRDLIDGNVDAVGGHQACGRLEDPLAVALCVGSKVPLSHVRRVLELLFLGRPRDHRSSCPGLTNGTIVPYSTP